VRFSTKNPAISYAPHTLKNKTGHRGLNILGLSETGVFNTIDPNGTLTDEGRLHYCKQCIPVFQFEGTTYTKCIKIWLITSATQ